MTEKQAKKIFDKYNPKSGVVRCPNGRAAVRKRLNEYAMAAVNLYGVISKAELAEIFNSQNEEQTTEEEIYILLLPLVLKNGYYCFYADHLVHYWMFDDFDFADYVIREQEGKPRFLPHKKEFIKFANCYYESEKQRKCWSKLLDQIFKMWPDSPNRYRFYSELKDMSFFSSGTKGVGELLEKYGLSFEDDDQVQKFFDLLVDARNNTRIWPNKGYAPEEIFKVEKKKLAEEGAGELVKLERIKVGQNDPCPCGSGKKYKKCCKLTMDSKTAQLSYRECALFYVTWYGLLGFVNEKKKVINSMIRPMYPNPLGDDQIIKVREVLWNHPNLIDDYVKAVKLPEEQVELLRSWRRHYKQGGFILAGYTPDHALLIGTIEEKSEAVYAVKGISRPFSDAMNLALPTQIDTVLLPFKDKIIYDGFIKSFAISFGDGMRKVIQETKEKAIEEQSIVSRFT
ncbi:hypothetical protein EOM86_00935 [Candidatus Nomurabacteria bacterium]|nr:hypothetical protein [Candidatus Nomurabacteria bacterium]